MARGARIADSSIPMPDMSRRRFLCDAAVAVTQLSFTFDTSPNSHPPKAEWRPPFLDCVDDGSDFSDYDLARYREDIRTFGLSKCWERICRWLLEHGEGEFLQIQSLGHLYEEGLAVQDKFDKKHNGQYYTPGDVAAVMAEWLERLPGEDVCDVGCGVGNLILAYLDRLGKEKAAHILRAGRVHLYDLDETALCICLVSIGIRYGLDAMSAVHVQCGDFLDAQVLLPSGSKVISNPPYAAVRDIPSTWRQTAVVLETKELYSAFMEKIFLQSGASVVITPYSFIGGEKFYPLRRIMNGRNGFVISFDNVPGAVFCGRKHGIFNSNTGNSVRAAITVVEGSPTAKGFRFSPLIRFKSVERACLMTCRALEGFLGSRRQLVSPDNPMFAKCDRRLEDVYRAWVMKSDSVVQAHVSPLGNHCLSMPNTCRYFTVATDERLARKGQVVLSFADEEVYWYVFCMINSSFAYWHWRLFDGGITYPKGLLLRMPLFFGALGESDRRFCREMARRMIRERGKYVIRKANVGMQENVKYPRAFRDAINERFLHVLGLAQNARVFDVVHSNMAFEVSR